MPKDIERALDVLQVRFAIVRGRARFWDKKSRNNIMQACVILHNMIIEDEKDMDLKFFFDNVGSCVKPQRNPNRVEAFPKTYRQIENRETHTQLHEDHMEHHSKLFGRQSPILFIFIYVWFEPFFPFRTIHYLFNYLIWTIVVIWIIVVLCVTRGDLDNVHVKGLWFRETRGSGELDGDRTNTEGHGDFTQLQAPGG